MKRLGSLIIVIILGFGIYYGWNHRTEFKLKYSKEPKESTYVAFGLEAFDSIEQNYWEDPKGYSLPNIFKQALEKVSGSPQTLATSTREGVKEMLNQALLNATSSDAKKNLALNTLIVVLYNLQPVGRNGILSTAQETALRQNVSNINPAKDLYQDLGVNKGATQEEIVKSFEKKDKELSASTSPEAKAEREHIAYAKKVLSNPDNKSLYDSNQIEPTVWPKNFDGSLYVYIDKISPTTFFEFAKAIDNASTTQGLNSLIIDMRGNVGGSLDFVQNFLGLFMGPNQYAFDMFHQGKYEDQRTVQPKFSQLDRYSDIAIITDGMSQSTAEVISAAFKRLHLGKIVGVHTRGWGTVENTYPIKTEIDPTTKYSLFLVNSITLRDDNQPIEGRGVDPDLNTGDKNWQSNLSKYFRTDSIVNALKITAASAPIK